MKKRRIIKQVCFLIIILSITASQIGHAQIKTQIAPGDWHDPSLWFPSGVPSKSDSVTTLFDIYISPDSVARAQYVHIAASSTLDIQRNLNTNKRGLLIIEDSPGDGLRNDGHLNLGGRITLRNIQETPFTNIGITDILDRARLIIDTTQGDNGVFNDGRINLAGTLQVSNIEDNDLVQAGIRNEDSIFVDTSGICSITQIDGLGIYNYFGDIDSKGNIDISNTLNFGIRTFGQFKQDLGLIYLDTVNGGIDNNGDFILQEDGSLDIHYCYYGNAILNGFGNGLAEFTNYGSININDLPARGINNFIGGTFNNYGQIEIQDQVYFSPGDDVVISNEGIFYNHPSGILNINDLEAKGIYNIEESLFGDPYFENVGYISIVNLTDTAIINHSTFRNRDSLVIHSIEETGLFNTDSLINTPNGILDLYDVQTGIDNNMDTASIINQGLISLDMIGGHAVINNGILHNQNKIRIRNASLDAMVNNHKLTNDPNGQIRIQSLSENINGLINSHSLDTIINRGLIHIRNLGGIGTGIMNLGTLINEDSIELNNINGTAIFNQHQFTNANSGTVLVSDSTIYKPNAGCSNTGTLTNEGEMIIQHCGVGVTNNNIFLNKDIIKISHHSETGIINATNIFDGDLTNEGNITIENSVIGVFNSGTWINSPMGLLHINTISDIPFESNLGSIFEGDGEIDIKVDP